MSLESPNKPRKIGEHFISEGIRIASISDRLVAKPTKVTEEEKFRLFLRDLESSMQNYR